MSDAQPLVATTTQGQRVFDNAIAITWTPSTTDVSIVVTIAIYANVVSTLYFDTTSTIQQFNVSGDNFSTKGTFEVQFDATGAHGTLSSDSWTWTIGTGGQQHSFQGQIGTW